MASSLDSRPLMSPSRPSTAASQRELDRELVETSTVTAQRRPSTKVLKLLASHVAAFLAGAAALALLLFLLPAPPPSPSSAPSPAPSFFSPPRALLDALCEVPTKRLLEARSGRGYFAALDDAAAALPPAVHLQATATPQPLLLPAAGGVENSISDSIGRLVFVGDVHGCADEFGQLLRKVGFRKGRDTLVLLGDVVSKGPDSARALRMARELGALSVRGNHDDAALAACDFSRRHGGALPKVSRGDTGGEDFAFVLNLTGADARFLREMPWTLEIPAMAAVAVHAGLVPGVAVNRQNPSDVFTMRGVVEVSDDGDGCGGSGGGGGGDCGGGNFIVRSWRWLLRTLFHRNKDNGSKHTGGEEEDGRGKTTGKKVSFRATAAVGEGVPWAEAWSALPGQNKHAVFGHDSRRGVQLERWATGIDSDCVGGGELTALVVPLPTSSRASSSSTAAAAAAASGDGDDGDGGDRKLGVFAAGRAPEGRWPDRDVELVSVKCHGAHK